MVPSRELSSGIEMRWVAEVPTWEIVPVRELNSKRGAVGRGAHLGNSSGM